MKQTLTQITAYEQEAKVDFEYPKGCPICLHKIAPGNVISDYFNKETNRLQVVLICPNTECSQFFIGSY